MSKPPTVKSKGDKKMDYDAASSKKRSKKRSKSGKDVSDSSLSVESTSSLSSSSSDQSRKRRKRKQKRKRRPSSSSDCTSSSSSYSSEEDDSELSRAKKYILKKSRTKKLINFLPKSYKAEELKHLRSEYAPKFASKTFDCKRPKLDRQMKRRLKRVRSHEASRAITREKNLANNQFKILDVFRPLLYSWALIGSGESSEENPIYAAVVGAFKLPGHCFNYLSGQRRSNILSYRFRIRNSLANAALAKRRLIQHTSSVRPPIN